MVRISSLLDGVSGFTVDLAKRLYGLGWDANLVANVPIVRLTIESKAEVYGRTQVYCIRFIDEAKSYNREWTIMGSQVRIENELEERRKTRPYVFGVRTSFVSCGHHDINDLLLNIQTSAKTSYEDTIWLSDIVHYLEILSRNDNLE